MNYVVLARRSNNIKTQDCLMDVDGKYQIWYDVDENMVPSGTETFINNQQALEVFGEEEVK